MTRPTNKLRVTVKNVENLCNSKYGWDNEKTEHYINKLKSVFANYHNKMFDSKKFLHENFTYLFSNSRKYDNKCEV